LLLWFQVGDASHLSRAMPAKIGQLVDRALFTAWHNDKDETPLAIVKEMIKWGNFISVWRFYSKFQQG